MKTLKPRKQNNWQSWLRNKSGAKSRVRFNVETGEFENYAPAHEDRQCEKLSATWVQVTPMSRWRRQGQCRGNRAHARSYARSGPPGPLEAIKPDRGMRWPLAK